MLYMKNNLVAQSEESKGVSPAQTLKLVVFQIKNLYVALPIAAVEKIISNTPIYSSGLNHFGVAHLGEKEITVIDLHKKLFKVSQPKQHDYLIITQTTQGENFGIMSEETPSLYEDAFSQIRTLPESYRRADTLEIASHVTVISQNKKQITVFVLDVDRILPHD